ncbi:MAG: hypothetical protein VW879_17385, partial [Opitutae bacterium]
RRYRTDGQYTNTRIESRTEAKTSRTDGKANLILAKSEKAKQTAAKRKWLVFLIGIAMAAYMLFKSKIGG